MYVAIHHFLHAGLRKMVATVSVASPTGGAMTPKAASHSGKKVAAVADSPGFSGGGNRAPETDDPLLNSIASKQGALVQQVITLTCYIPSSSVGAVIGRRGSTIAQIQRQAQQVGGGGPVRLSIVGHQNEIAAVQNGESPDVSMEQSQSSPTQLQSQNQQVSTPLQSTTASVPYTYCELDWSSPFWTPVVIRADPCAAITAAQLLQGKVGQLDDVVMDVPLGRAKHAAIVGRRGYVLANLSADTNVRIMVPRRELRHDVIQLEGELENVKQCLQRILVISSDPASGSKKRGNSNTGANTSTGNNANGSGAQQNEKSEEPLSVVVTMSVLPSQTKLRTVGRKTETIIKKKKVDDSSWDLTIAGSGAENVQAAATMLRKWKEDNVNNSNNVNSSTAASGNSGTPSRSRGRGRQQGRSNKNRGGNNKNKAHAPG